MDPQDQEDDLVRGVRPVNRENPVNQDPPVLLVYPDHQVPEDKEEKMVNQDLLDQKVQEGIVDHPDLEELQVCH